MAKLDWLFLPIDIDEEGGDEGARRLPVRVLNRLFPQPNILDVRKNSRSSEQSPGHPGHHTKPALKRRRR